MAPDAELYLVAFDTNASAEEAVRWIVAQGIPIISASFGSTYYPADGKTSPLTQLVDQSTKQNGILWAIS